MKRVHSPVRRRIDYSDDTEEVDLEIDLTQEDEGINLTTNTPSRSIREQEKNEPLPGNEAQLKDSRAQDTKTNHNKMTSLGMGLGMVRKEGIVDCTGFKFFIINTLSY